ncbi:MAG: hypothetical protein HPAVJP_0160 [Candidatus Hepatoplasma vulgare]|nr:MAG: hypothetical protein HPAVJP_0160 [Candidatus Hepatoplasma sp.]
MEILEQKENRVFLKGQNPNSPNNTSNKESNQEKKEINSPSKEDNKDSSFNSKNPSNNNEAKTPESKTSEQKAATDNTTVKPTPQQGKPNSNNPNQKPPQMPPQKLPKKKTSTLAKILWIIVIVLLIFLIFAIIFGVRTEYVYYDEFFNNLTLATNNATPNDPVYLNWNINDGGYVTASFIYDDIQYVTYFDDIQQAIDLSNQYLSNFDVLISSGLLEVVPQNPEPSFFAYLILSWLPWLFFFVLAWVIIKMVVDKQQSAGKIQKKSLTPQISTVTFKDVEGYSEIKQELSEIVDFMRNSAKYSAAGARVPKGVLLSGPPGTGKTLFAKAIAGESKIPFYSISGSDFVEMFVGVGASRVRSLFDQAKKTAPSLIFIDELDAVGRVRGAGSGGGNDEREQTLNQMLVEMDGFTSNTGIVIIAATNRPDILDPALKRPGRFDRSIDIRLPDINEREAILKLHARKGNKKFASDINWRNIASRTPGFSGAELENVINESAILSVRLNIPVITLDIIDESIDRVIGGPAKVNNAMSREEKELIAHHEAGHALIGLKLEHAEKVQKISIVPRGQAGGYVLMTPKKEKIVQTKAELIAKIISYMGGRASEEIFFGKENVTTGAYSDIQEATIIARRMIAEFGMSEKLGPVQYDKPEGMYYLRSSIDRTHSEKVAYEIDLEVKTLIETSYKNAHTIINNNKSMIKLFAKALLIKEVLNKEEIDYIYKHKKLTEQMQEMEK